MKVPEGFDGDTHDSCESFHKKDATKDAEEKFDPIKALLDKEAKQKAKTLKIKQRLFSKPNYFNSHIIKPKKQHNAEIMAALLEKINWDFSKSAMDSSRFHKGKNNNSSNYKTSPRTISNIFRNSPRSSS